MAEGFVNDLIASQESMNRRCDKVLSSLQKYFESFMIGNQQKRNKFYLEFTNPKNGTFHVWIFDENRQPTGFGLEIYALMIFFEVTLVRKILDQNGDENLTTFETIGSCDLFRDGRPRHIRDADGMQKLISEVAVLLVTENKSDVLAPKKDR